MGAGWPWALVAAACALIALISLFGTWHTFRQSLEWASDRGIDHAGRLPVVLLAASVGLAAAAAALGSRLQRLACVGAGAAIGVALVTTLGRTFTAHLLSSQSQHATAWIFQVFGAAALVFAGIAAVCARR